MPVSRRHILIGLAATSGVTVAAAAGMRHVLRPSQIGELITPVQAHELTARGDILLVDIRRPDEWARTGLSEGAVPLDMRRRDFTQALSALVDNDTARPVALICAGGVRSRMMTTRLQTAGFTRVIDIPEGMMGSRAGPGWIARGLPTISHSES